MAKKETMSETKPAAKKTPAKKSKPKTKTAEKPVAATGLIGVKTALLEKYTRLARTAGSEPKRKAFLNKARKYQQQVLRLTRASQ